MRRFLVTASVLLAFAWAASAQSASEIAAARTLAKQYGYSESEINGFITAAGVQNPQNPGVPPVGVTPTGEELAIVTPAKEPDPEREPSEVYGHDFFFSEGMGMIPLYNAPAPESYILGAGDEVTIDIWGAATQSVTDVIAKDGSVRVPSYGPVYIAGMTVANAEKALKSRLARVYGGLSGGSSNLKLSLGRIKGVTVNVIGEVAVPGVYNLPSLSSVVSAIYMAGGITEEGSVREITLYREGKAAAVFDLYAFIFDGKYDAGLRLQENDIISVASRRNIVTVGGAVVRAMKYEMRDGETISDLVKFAGGFEALAARSVVHVDRMMAEIDCAYDVPQESMGTFPLVSGDEVYVSGSRVRYKNRLAIAGAVRHGGVYALSDQVSTVKDLIDLAGGLTPDAYTDRAIIVRTDEAENPYTMGFSLKDVVEGRVSVPLQSNDSIKIFAIADLRQPSTVEIRGEVNEPGTFDYGEGMTVGDLILMASGFTERAAPMSIEVASRGKDDVGKVTSIDLEADPSLVDFPLEPFDMVFVRRYAYHRPQQTIQIDGEVNYPGTYVIEKSTVRLSDVIARAGGINDNGYAKGAKLTRVLSEEEYARLLAAVEIVENQMDSDSTSVDIQEIGDSFTIAIDLEEALANPGSAADVTLREGDILDVPQLNNTVKISGAVLYPNTVTFMPGYSWKDYVSQAGGFLKGARKGKTYVVYMNGSAAAKGNKNFKMEPGMEIVVPKIDEEQRHQVSMTEIAALASSTSSIAYMAAILLNMFKK